jgi:hypothetical protein
MWIHFHQFIASQPATISSLWAEGRGVALKSEEIKEMKGHLLLPKTESTIAAFG